MIRSSNTSTSKEIQKILQKKIKNNTKFVDEINQYLHNKGVELIKRYDVITTILLDNENNFSLSTQAVAIDSDTIEWIREKLINISIDKNEIYQIIFMFFGNQYFKKQLDQFYTPMTICNFINSLLLPGKTAIDPACGTGDLLNYYSGHITLVDKSETVLEMTKFISKNLGNRVLIVNKDSLTDFPPPRKYEYCVMNPPFGCKTVITNKNILDKYVLGKSKSKQEIGILFVELGLRLLKKNGILFAIVPNGYLGNTNANYIALRRLIIDNYTLLGIIKLPDSAFSRSGTGVATSIMVIQNTKPEKDYPIFIENVTEIGYILNKKNTPFKYKTDSEGFYLYDSSLNPVIDEGLSHARKLFQTFIYDNKISNLSSRKTEGSYEILKKKDLDNRLILDIKRYLSVYKNIIQKSNENQDNTLGDYCVGGIDFKFKKNKPMYNYIDIKCVNSPLYSFNSYSQITLPSRGKYKVDKGDVLISKLKGKISFTVITESMDDLIASNGFGVVRPRDHNSLVIIFANLFSEMFKIQHQSMVTGSIMETLSDADIKNIYIKEDIDYEKYNSILSSITILNRELTTVGTY